MRARIRKIPLFLGLATMISLSAQAAETPQAATGGKATVTVTAIGKKDTAPPPISKDDLQLTVSKERKQVAGWTKGESLGLAILIDEALDTSAAGQWNELKGFINELPANTSVAVAYASNSTAMVAQDFTTDHAQAAKALRIPRGALGAGSSPYLSVIDWMKRWPSNGQRRSLLLISSGIDYFRGSFGPIYPDVDTAVSIAQKGNVNLWSIYYPSIGHRGRRFGLVNLAQNSLTKMSEETGGEAYYLGTSAPVAFKPYLDELLLHLTNQYLLTFTGDGGEKGKFTRFHLKTEVPDVEFSHADNAFTAPSK
jgi:hypothetical protein